jgi:hypothetical protein
VFSNTDTKIRLDDVRYTQDIQNIGTRNWCKAVVDRLSVAARLYKLDYAQKDINAPISGCTIFLVVSSSQISFFSCSCFHCFFATVYIFLLQSYFHCCNLVLPEFFLQLVFASSVFFLFFIIFLQMLYVDNLQHGFQTSPFSISRCSFLASKMIQAILNEDRRGMSLATLLSLDISRFVFLQISPLFFYSNCGFCNFFIFVNIRFFPVAFFNDLQLKSITDTCYGAPVGYLTVLPLPRFGPA